MKDGGSIKRGDLISKSRYSIARPVSILRLEAHDPMKEENYELIDRDATDIPPSTTRRVVTLRV